MNTTYDSLDTATNTLLSYAPVSQPKAYDLSLMKQLMKAVGSPETRLRVIHVAGTSGKTSTCYYIRGLLEAAGKKTGLTVSPHITAINERVQISGESLAEESFLHYFTDFMQLVDASGLKPSYYELTMALAYFVFAEENVDYAVIETGLGGLLDGSNVAQEPNKICVIQRIGYDHTEILGETLPEITLQKAGIIHDSNIVFVLDQPDEIMAVIAGYGKKKHARLYTISETNEADLPVRYQQANWAMAYAVYEYLVQHEGVRQLQLDELKKVKQLTPPGRYEVYTHRGKTVIFDGAHNGQKLAALMSSMQEKKIDKPRIVLSLKNTDKKKIEECIAAVVGHCEELILTTFRIGQDSRVIENADLKVLYAFAQKYGLATRIIEDQRQAFEYAVSTESKVIVITGSLYLVSEMRRLIAN